MSLFPGPKKQKTKTVVCPICWRKSCPLFRRLEGFKFTDDEKTRFFTAFHRDVCLKCHGLACGHDMSKCDVRKFNNKRSVLPLWWLKGQHN